MLLNVGPMLDRSSETRDIVDELQLHGVVAHGGMIEHQQNNFLNGLRAD